VGDQSHIPAALCPEKGPIIHCTPSIVGFRMSLDGCEKLVTTRIQLLDRASHSESLHRLSYPSPLYLQNRKMKSVRVVYYRTDHLSNRVCLW
jgi:hypothetical protein